MISTRNLQRLPEPSQLRAVFQAMAMLDAIIMPEWESRYYSFEADPLPERGICIGSMRNGSGDDLHAIFGPAGCLLRGFAHEYEMSPYAHSPPKVFPGVLDDVPAEFSDCRSEVHDDYWRDLTFCVWRRYTDSEWHCGRIDFPNLPDPDGSEFLLSIFDGRPESYLAWAEQYYEPLQFSLAAVRSVFEHRPLTESIVRELNPERSFSDLVEEIRRIGYGNGSAEPIVTSNGVA